MARSTGIEITETSVRVAELDGSAKKYRIVGAAEVPIEVDEDGARGPQAVQQALRTALKAARSKREQVVLGLPATKAIIREIVIPFTDPEQIRKVIKFESESHLPAGNVDDVIVGFHKVGESGPRSRLLIIAVQKQTLREHIEILGRAGVDPNQVDLDAAALFSLTRLLPELDGDDETLANVVLDIGEATTNVLVGTGPHLRLVRSIRLGADTLTRTLSHELGIDRTEAKTVTTRMLTSEMPFATVGDVEPREPSRAVAVADLREDIIRDKGQDFARRIANEVRRSLSSIQLEGRVAGIWLTGPASAAPGLAASLGTTFGVQARTLDVLHGADHNLEPAAGLYAGTAIGLALKGLEHDPLGLEFRQEEFRFARKLERLKTPLLLGLALLLAVLCFLSIVEFLRHRAIRAKVERLAQFGDMLFADRHLRPASDIEGPARQGVESIGKILGYQDAADVKSVAEQAKKPAPSDRIGRMLALLRRPTDYLAESYGVTLTHDEKNLPPEQEARSALYRLDQFIGIFNRVGERLGTYYVDKLDVSSTKITWTMRTQSPEAFAILQEEFAKLDGYRDSRAAKLSTRGDMQLYENAIIEFEPER